MLWVLARTRRGDIVVSGLTAPGSFVGESAALLGSGRTQP